MRDAPRLLAAALLVALGAVAPVAAQQARMVRPGIAEEATPVLLSFVVVDVVEIDAVDESFELDFVISARWRDERLAWESDGETAAMIYGLDDIWHPRVTVLNSRGLTPMFPRELEVAPDGEVHYLQRFQGSLRMPLDLEDFPFDVQELAVRIIDVRYSPQEIRFEIDQERTLMLPSAALSGWRIELTGGRVEPLELAEGILAGVTLRIEADRDPGHFIWTMMLPLALIALMAWMVFWIDPSSMPAQIGLSTASVFSLMAYRTAIRMSLPEVSYITRADIFILGTTALVFGALVHAIATGRLAKTGHEDLARRLDRWARGVYVALMAVIVTTTLLW